MATTGKSKTNKVSKTSEPKRVKVYRDWCKRCGICVAFCPREALRPDEDGYPTLKDPEGCDGCGLCELMCPDFAIVVEDAKPSLERKQKS